MGICILLRTWFFPVRFTLCDACSVIKPSQHDIIQPQPVIPALWFWRRELNSLSRVSSRIALPGAEIKTQPALTIWSGLLSPHPQHTPPLPPSQNRDGHIDPSLLNPLFSSSVVMDASYPLSYIDISPPRWLPEKETMQKRNMR